MAFAATKTFWNIHKTWAHFVPPLVGFATVVYLVMHGTTLVWNALLGGLVCASIFYVIGWTGSFLINFIWSAPATIYANQVEMIEGLNAQVSSRSVSAQEQDNRKTVRALVANATDKERAVLRVLYEHDKMLGEQLYRVCDRDAVSSAIGKWTIKLIDEYVDPSNRTFWSIVPGLRDALVYVLYEDPKA
jgi:hypothetical protein